VAIVLQHRRGTESQNDNFTGVSGELTVDTTNKELRLHDGVTLGGKIVSRIPDIGTIAELKLMVLTPEKIFVTGYHTENDGAFGSHFYRLATDTGQVDNSGTIIRTVNGVYELQYEGAVNVKWFGAKGLGSNLDDDYESFQAALNSAVAIGKSVTVPKGVFFIGSQLVCSVNFYGESKLSSIIVSKIADSINNDGTQHLLKIISGESGGVNVTSLTLRGSMASQCGLYVASGQEHHISNMYVEGFHLNAVRMGNGTGEAPYWCTISGIRINDGRNNPQSSIAGSIGWIVDGGFPSTNANSMYDCVIGGDYGISIDMGGTDNKFYNGTIEVVNGTNITNLLNIKGSNCKIVDVYAEPVGTTLDVPVLFSAGSIHNEVTLSYHGDTAYQLSTTNILGEKNKLNFNYLGSNFSGYVPDEGGQNLYGNGDFRLWKDANTPIGFNAGSAGITQGGVGHDGTFLSSLRITTTANNANITLALDSMLGLSRSSFRGMNISASVYVKIVSGDCEPQIKFNTTTSYKVPNDGLWHLITATQAFPFPSVSVAPTLELRSHHSNVATTGLVEFSGLMITTTRTPRRWSQAPLITGDRAGGNANNYGSLSFHNTGNAATSPAIQLGGAWLFVDASGVLRIKKSFNRPTSDTDGVVVGTQV
jgi:hypothetical protein